MVLPHRELQIDRNDLVVQDRRYCDQKSTLPNIDGALLAGNQQLHTLRPGALWQRDSYGLWMGGHQFGEWTLHSPCVRQPSLTR